MMRWKPKPEPKIGDRRAVKRFAFLPTCASPHIVWLEHYWGLEEYSYRLGWLAVRAAPIEEDTYLWRTNK